jgi:hypothetical protein
MKRLLTMKLTVSKLLLVCLAGTLALPATMSAQAAKHPEFLHALSDLRAARGYLDQLTSNQAVDSDSAKAIHEINDAITDLKKASIDDGKDLNWHPPVDASLGKTGRFHKAKELLEKAHNDVAQPETDAQAQALQSRILGHISEAHRAVDQAIAAAGH